MDGLGDANIPQRRLARNIEHDELDMRIRARKAQERDGGNPYPRVIIHVPEWLGKFTILGRGLKLVLAGVALSAVVGTYLLISELRPKKYEFEYAGGQFSAIQSAGTFLPENAQVSSPPPPGTPIPLKLSNLADVSLPIVPSDIPFFLDLEHSSGSKMSEMLGKCAGKVLALDAPSFIVGGGSQDIKPIDTPNIGKIVNVDTYTVHGINEAINKGLTFSGEADVILSPLLYDAASLFASSHRGRLFTVIHHPIQRIYTHFLYIQSAIDDTNYQPLLSNIDIEHYAKLNEDRKEFNYMTKLLSNSEGKSSEELTIDDLNKAKEILRRKVLVGLFEEKTESISRFENYFGFHIEYVNSSDKLCGKGLSDWSQLEQDTPILNPTDAAWDLLLKRNLFDMDLYEYAKVLFAEQGKALNNGNN